nr:hypothetical protein [Agitococcus sp.]
RPSPIINQKGWIIIAAVITAFLSWAYSLNSSINQHITKYDSGVIYQNTLVYCHYLPKACHQKSTLFS